MKSFSLLRPVGRLLGSYLNPANRRLTRSVGVVLNSALLVSLAFLVLATTTQAQSPAPEATPTPAPTTTPTPADGYNLPAFSCGDGGTVKSLHWENNVYTLVLECPHLTFKGLAGKTPGAGVSD